MSFPLALEELKRSLQLEFMKLCWTRERCHGFAVISLEHEWCAESEQPFHGHLNCPEPLPFPVILHPFRMVSRVRNKPFQEESWKSKGVLYLIKQGGTAFLPAFNSA